MRAAEIAAEQAEDEGLWFRSVYASEAYLQAALRRLTAAVESEAGEIERLRGLYEDLIMQVGMAWPGETRHETARRYIQQAEAPQERESAALEAKP